MNLAPLLLALCCTPALAQVDPRFAGPPARYADGTIKRSTMQRALFVQMHPCPSTGEVTGSCPGWSVNHTLPLICGGADLPVNMSWMPNVLKSGPGTLPVDRWERKVYCHPQVLVPMPAEQLRLLAVPIGP